VSPPSPKPSPPLRPCVFFDRDGIVNRSPSPKRYVESWPEFVFLPEILPVLETVKTHGYAAVLVTNQRGVSLGCMSQEAVDDIHRRLQELLSRHGLGFLEVMVCPEDDGVSDRRKPGPGMLREAAARHGLDLAQSWMVGDSETDVEAGRRAGCRTIRVLPEGEPTTADFRVQDLGALALLLDRCLNSSGDSGS